MQIQTLDIFYKSILTNPLIKEHQFISTATVPVIKLKFRGDCFNSKTDYSVDITLTDNSVDEHFQKGFQTINFVQTSFNQTKILKPVCLILKNLLRTHSLNEPYTGGLGSFALFVLVLSVYNRVGNEQMTAD